MRNGRLDLHPTLHKNISRPSSFQVPGKSGNRTNGVLGLHFSGKRVNQALAWLGIAGGYKLWALVQK